MADDQLLALLRAALERLPERDSALRVQVMARLAVELSYTEDLAGSDELSRAAVEMAERLGDKKILLLAMYSRQWSVRGPDGVEEAHKAGEEIVRLARVASDRDMEFHGHHLKVIALMQLGHMSAVDQEIDACEKVASDLRQPAYEHQAATFRAMRAIMQGRFKEGERLAQSALQIGERADREIAAVTYGAHAFLTNWATGTNLEGLVEGGRAFAERYGQAWPAALVWLLTETGATEEAAERMHALASKDFTDMARNANWLTSMCALAVACTAIGDERVAATLHELLLPYAEQCSPVLAGAGCLGSNHAFVGFTAAACGRHDEAIQCFERALERNEQIGAHYIAARICYECSRALLARGQIGDDARARQMIQRGIEYARKLGMARELERLLTSRADGDGLKGIDVRTSIDDLATSVELNRPDLRPAAAPDGTVTILFSDIEDSTVLTERLGDRRWHELLRNHNEIVRKHLASHGGFEVKNQGDGFMLAFPSARHAVMCATDIQRGLAAHREQQPDEPIRVRIGLHTGEAIKDRDDFFGKNVILAARIGAEAKGDEILVSSLLKQLVESSGELSFDTGREIELKGLSGSYEVFAVLWEPVASQVAG
jgi:class 3 adenylate cyclase